MNFFFVHDVRRRHRFFSSDPLDLPQVKMSKPRAVWNMAKTKVIRLLPRILRQEQAFERGGRDAAETIRILHSGRMDEKKMRKHFHVFLRRQRSRHVAVLVGEALLIPISILAAFLPGPNVFFYFLAVLMIIQWEALRGMARLVHKEHEFESSPLLSEWEAAVASGDETLYPGILDRIEQAFGLKDIRRILWK